MRGRGSGTFRQASGCRGARTVPVGRSPEGPAHPCPPRRPTRLLLGGVGLVGGARRLLTRWRLVARWRLLAGWRLADGWLSGGRLLTR